MTACSSDEAAPDVTPDAAPDATPDAAPAAMPDPETEPSAPDTSVTEEPAEQPAPVGTMAENEAITILACDKTARTLRFTFTNTGDDKWAFTPLPFPPPRGVLDVNVYVNNYELTKLSPYFDPETDERFFGPGDSFEENCGVTELSPGESATCDLTKVPLLRDGNTRQDQVWLSAPEGNIRLFFDCE